MLRRLASQEIANSSLEESSILSRCTHIFCNQQLAGDKTYNRLTNSNPSCLPPSTSATSSGDGPCTRAPSYLCMTVAHRTSTDLMPHSVTPPFSCSQACAQGCCVRWLDFCCAPHLVDGGPIVLCFLHYEGLAQTDVGPKIHQVAAQHHQVCL